MDEASPLEKWKSWIIEATFSKSKTEQMLNLTSILNFKSLLLKVYFKSFQTPVSPGRQMVKGTLSLALSV